ncbi:peptidase [Escherichia sp. E2593]|uniref:peptidase n=1 Tax=unclassified Escherichia TaxID=2608889 RepID=UPI001028F181|nr:MULTISPECIES: peptidase [unclassified Escherichia]RZN40403.1 peptidase [Escherichia sp. E10V5]TGC06833.1 peptidase [Escherichia sp. E2593]TLI81907.1 peptidase [Escherichia sp. E2593]
MNLFERLLHCRLCNEQPADGGAAPASSEPAAASSAPAGEAVPAGGEPQPGAEGGGQPGEQKQEGENKDGDKNAGEEGKDGKKDDKPEGAPDKYDFKTAEGVELDTAALADFEPVARELNLSNEQAQKLVDAYPKILAGVQQRQTEAWQKQTEDWAAEVKADKEIGGDKLTSNLSLAQRALDTFGPPGLKDYLSSTGLGNHPDLVRAFVKIGATMTEDNMVTGKETGQRSAAEVLYGK